MKKRILAIVLSVILILGAFSGCGLLTEDPNRVADQSVVTVGQGEYQQVVTRRELMNLYNTYGPMYMYYYQMSLEDVMNLFVNSLINEKIITYSALNNLEKVSTVTSKDKNAIYDVYLTAQEMNDIAIKVDKVISGAIENLEVEALRKKAEIEAPKYKTTPTGFEYYTATPVDFVGTSSRNSAYAQLKRNLLTNGMTFEGLVAEQTLAYKREAVVNKYREQIQSEVTVTDEEVMIRYNTLLDKEKEQYAISSDAFKKKLSAVSANKDFGGDNFILTVPQAGLGFVHSILMQFNQEQQDQIAQWKKAVEDETMTKEEFEAKKKELLKNITVTDNRIDWLKEYGTSTNLFEKYAFDGVAVPKKVENVQVMDANGEFAFEELTSNEYGVTDFMTKLQNELSATKGNLIDGFQIYNTTNKNEKFLDLVWAYGDDPGMENNLVGYMSEDTSFVKEYVDAAKAVVKGGVGSYTLVESPDYGYFVVYCSSAYDKVGQVEYNPAEKNVEGTFSYKFYNEVNDALNANYFDEKMSAISSSYMKDDKFITLNQKVLDALMNSIQ